MKAYIKPLVRMVEIEPNALLAESGEVEFRFSTRVDEEWEDSRVKGFE